MHWFTGFVLHKIAFGLLSVLLPLYITQVISGGTLTIWGMITASATLLAIPFSFMWGYFCDSTRHYRIFILLSFAAVTALLYIFSITTDLLLLWLLYVAIVLFQVAYEPPKNVLIAETYFYEDWRHGFALYGAWTQLGWVVGLLLGFLLVFLGLNNTTLLLASVFLSLLSFLFSVPLIKDPTLIFERTLVAMDKSVSLVQRGAMLLSRMDFDSDVKRELGQENTYAFCAGLVLFSLATSVFFIPLPVFFAKTLALQTSAIFALFLINSTSCFLGYTLTLRNANNLDATATIRRASLFRSFLVLLPIAVGIIPFSGALVLSIIVLAVMGFVYASYSVAVLSLSMEVIPQGKVGLLTALVGIGSGIGCFVGPIIADSLGFQYMFIISASCSFLGFVAFKKFAKVAPMW